MSWNAVEMSIGEATGEPFNIERRHSLGGGCINEAYRIDDGQRRFFVKLNSRERLAMFEAEAAGLDLILGSQSIRAPEPVCTGNSGDWSFLVLELIEFSTSAGGCSERFGEQLAGMHRKTSELFGWGRDNTIGSTLQVNASNASWVSFFKNHRLAFQLDLAQKNRASNALIDSGQQLLQEIPAFFSSYQPKPSLLHGDLWGGNWGTDGAGNPVIFDPAVYFGDREADLAMTELFGGFDDRFYHSYRRAWALDPGYSTRKALYNLYHILNHYNLFGGGYAGQAQNMIDQLLAEVSS